MIEKVTETLSLFFSIIILSKLFWAKDSHSEMQLFVSTIETWKADVRNLLKEETDMDYIKKWAKKLSIFELLQEVLKEGVALIVMRDTDEATERLYRKLMSEKSGEERVKMAFSMFRFAGEIVFSSLRAKGVEERDLRKEAFLRIYGNDFSEEEKRKIIEAIESFEKNNK